MPAAARLSMAVGVFSAPARRMASARPGASRSMTALGRLGRPVARAEAGPAGRQDEVEALVRPVDERRPDLVLFVGDDLRPDDLASGGLDHLPDGRTAPVLALAPRPLVAHGENSDLHRHPPILNMSLDRHSMVAALPGRLRPRKPPGGWPRARPGPAFSSRRAFRRSIPPRSKRQTFSRPSGPSRSRSQPRQKGSETGVMKPRRVFPLERGRRPRRRRRPGAGSSGPNASAIRSRTSSPLTKSAGRQRPELLAFRARARSSA